MIWLFILATILTYTFVMKYVLNNIQNKKIMTETNSLLNKSGNNPFAPAQTTR